MSTSASLKRLTHWRSFSRNFIQPSKVHLLKASSLKVLCGSMLALGTLASNVSAHAADQTLTNASYDIARELFVALNPPFIEQWQKAHGGKLDIKQTHAGSSTQVRAIQQGLRADVVTFNQTSDVDTLVKAGLISPDWKSRLADNSSPYYSTMAFLVRKGNPKGIKTWSDLAKPDVKIVFPNPKTSGNGRYTYLAAWAAEQQADQGDTKKTEDFMRKLLANVAVFDTGGRGATTSFVERGIGDVLISFESEINNIRNAHEKDGYDVIVPPVDLLAEFPVAWVDDSVKRNHSEELSKAYLEYLYSPQAQRIIAENYYRVRNPDVAKEFSARFPNTQLLDINNIFGSWEDIQKTHFASGGELDKLQRP